MNLILRTRTLRYAPCRRLFHEHCQAHPPRRGLDRGEESGPGRHHMSFRRQPELALRETCAVPNAGAWRRPGIVPNVYQNVDCDMPDSQPAARRGLLDGLHRFAFISSCVYAVLIALLATPFFQRQ